MPPRYQHLFWDFDGTLYDSYGLVTQAMLLALGDRGHFVRPQEVYALLKQSVSLAVGTLSKRLSLEASELGGAFMKHHQSMEGFPLFEGASACLRRLKEAGCQHYLYTHRDCSALRQLERDGLAPLFTGCVTREAGYPGKPAPDALNAMMAEHGIAPSQSVMIGDRDLDVQAGRNAGMAGILFDPKGFYPDAEADFRAMAMEEITEWILRA